MDKFPEAFARFEKEIDLSEVKDPHDITVKFRFWQGRNLTAKQKEALLLEAKKRGIIVIEKIEKPRPLGISKRKGVPREQLKRHYTTHMIRGKTRMVARIPKGQKGAGRFAKKG